MASPKHVVAQRVERSRHVHLRVGSFEQVVVETLAGDEGAQVVDVALAFGERAPTEQPVEDGHEHGSEEQAVDGP